MKSMSGFGGGVASLTMKSAGAGGGEIITDNLVFHLDAGNTSSYSGSGTTWNDLSNGMSGTPNDATLTNGPTFDSGNGGSIVLDGNDDRVNASNFFNANDNFTFSIWLNSDTFSGTNAYTIISSHTHSAAFKFVYVNGSGLRISKSWVGPTVGTFSSSTLSTGTWYNLTITREMTSYPTKTYTLYINGSFISNFTSTVTYNRYPKCIGASWSETNTLWDGKIAKVFAYSTNLTASEVLQNYNATKSRFGTDQIITDNLVLNLDANNYTSGSTWTDTSGQGNNGTINGATYNSGDGGYFIFDGTNDYVSLGTSINSHISVHKDCSFNIWMQFDIDSRDNVIITHPTIGSGNDRFLIWYDKSAFGTPNNTGGNDVGGGTTNIITVHVKNTTGAEYRWTTSNNVFGNNTTNTWHNICVVLDTTNDKYYTYLNGQQVALFNSTSVQGIDSNTGGVGQDFYIGRSNNSHNSWLDGKISQFLVYSKALSPADVQRNFDAEKERFGLS